MKSQNAWKIRFTSKCRIHNDFGPQYVIVKKGSEGAELFSKKQKSVILLYN